MKNKKPKIYTYILLIPLLVALIGSAALASVSLIPAAQLWDNSFSSALQLFNEFNEDDHLSPATRREWSQDIYTDSLIIETSYSMDAAQFDNVLLNRIVPGGARPVRLIALLEGTEEANQSYSRYWMGFRVLIRPLLLFMSYYEIRALAGVVVFLLLTVVVAGLARRKGVCAALVPAAAFLLVEPWAVCSSIQFSVCFTLMLLLIALINHGGFKLNEERTVMLFCLFGALTQFFDFYTYPLIVFAVPGLVLVSDYEGRNMAVHLLRLFAAWISSWLVMWLIKQVFALVFCGGAELKATLESVAFRFGLGEVEEQVSYSVKEAFYRVWYYITDIPLKAAVLFLGVAIVALMIYSYVKHGKNLRLFVYLGVSALPLLWMAATAQPIYIHYWFQYRSLYVSFFALMLFALESLGLINAKGYSSRCPQNVEETEK